MDQRPHLIVSGHNYSGECTLPEGAAETFIGVPTNAPLGWLAGGARVVQVALGYAYTLLLADDNRLYAVGDNDYGQLGRGTASEGDPDSRVPRPVAGFGRERITQIASSFGHCAAVTEGGQVHLWGRNDYRECGAGTARELVLSATRCGSGALADDADVRATFVACGWGHTVVLTGTGGVVVFGLNNWGQLGTGDTDDQPTPVLLACAALDGVRIVGCAAGEDDTQLVSDDGRVFVMGGNGCGQLGTGDTSAVNTPTQIDAAHFGGAPVAAVACGACHTVAITRGEGKLYCWGRGDMGRTGLGHTKNATTPQPVVGALAGARVVRVAAGMFHTCALVEDGRVFVLGAVGGTPAAAAAAAQDSTARLMQGDALAGSTARVLGSGCYASHMALVTGEPPATAGFEAPLVFAMQKKPAPKTPKHTAAAASAAAAAAVAAPSIAARQPSSGGKGGGAAAASTYAVQGTKRKHGDSDGNHGDEGSSSSSSSSSSSTSTQAAPLC